MSLTIFLKWFKVSHARPKLIGRRAYSPSPQQRLLSLDRARNPPSHLLSQLQLPNHPMFLPTVPSSATKTIPTPLLLLVKYPTLATAKLGMACPTSPWSFTTLRQHHTMRYLLNHGEYFFVVFMTNRIPQLMFMAVSITKRSMVVMVMGSRGVMVVGSRGLLL